MRTGCARLIDVNRTTRERYEALPVWLRDQVDAILAPEVARGWIPKDADIEAAIAAVLRPRRGSADDG